MSEKCPDNMKPESVVDRDSTPTKVMTCKEYRKQYRECPVYRPEHVSECDVTIIGKRGRIRTVTYSEYLRIME